jgi:MFS transporter, DHA1 family, tetracycline resistance protein
MNQTNPPSRNPVFPIFLTAFIDMLGVGIIIPVLPSLFFNGDSSILPAEMLDPQRKILYGYLIACYPIMQFFGAPILGALSDRFGRKPLLMLSLLGTLIGYILFGYAILTKNLALLFASRMLPGFTGGNISIVFSALADIATPETRPKYFGLVGAAFGLGFILGPAIGGLLADNTLVSWFTHATPFWFTAILTGVNIVLVHFIFKETLATRQSTQLSLFSGFKNVKKAFSSPNLRVILCVTLFVSLGFSFFSQFFSVYCIEKWQTTTKALGLTFAWIGLWLVFTQAVLVRKLSTNYNSAQVLRWSLLFLGIFVGLVLIPPSLAWIWVVNPFIAMFQGMSAPNLTTVVSTQADKTQQGEIMGINQSMTSVGQAIPPIIAGYLASQNVSFPMLAASFFIILGWLVFVVFFKPKTDVG